MDILLRLRRHSEEGELVTDVNYHCGNGHFGDTKHEVTKVGMAPVFHPLAHLRLFLHFLENLEC